MVYGIVLYGMKWCMVLKAWYGVRYGIIRYDMVMVWKAWYDVWYGIIRYDMVYGMVLFGMV